MNHLVFLFLCASLISSLWYLFLKRKTRINIKFLYSDNILVIFMSFGLLIVIKNLFNFDCVLIDFLALTFNIALISFIITMIRFWRIPNRKLVENNNHIISPADGNILYIKKYESNEIPVSIKKGLSAKLDEILDTDLIKSPVWLIGINMTPFDVHKNCAPIGGKVILNKHIKGSFLSLKNPKAIIKNERNTLVIRTDNGQQFGIVQTASRLVRRIDSYIKVGQVINQGDWFGMIRFGSQVDLIIPTSYKICIELHDQVYAKSTIIAKNETIN